jgi:twitching motility two-component system response regulator PilH
MAKRAGSIEVIGYGLAFFYGIALLTYAQILKIAELRWYALAITIVFGVLFVSAIAVAKMKEWGRMLMVLANLIMGFMIALPTFRYIQIEKILPSNYISFLVLFAVIIVMFFGQEKIRRIFRMDTKRGWHSILVIDDDEIFLRTVRALLLSHGYAVLTARTGEHGLQIIRTQKPDLVLLDVILPGIKGRELCQQVKKDEATKHIPVVFVTAKDSPEDIRAEKASGAEMHLGKPVKPKELIAAVEQILSNRPAGTSSGRP